MFDDVVAAVDAVFVVLVVIVFLDVVLGLCP